MAGLACERKWCRPGPRNAGHPQPPRMASIQAPSKSGAAMTMSIARLSAQSGLRYLFKTTMMDDLEEVASPKRVPVITRKSVKDLNRSPIPPMIRLYSP